MAELAGARWRGSGWLQLPPPLRGMVAITAPRARLAVRGRRLAAPAPTDEDGEQGYKTEERKKPHGGNQGRIIHAKNCTLLRSTRGNWCSRLAARTFVDARY